MGYVSFGQLVLTRALNPAHDWFLTHVRQLKDDVSDALDQLGESVAGGGHGAARDGGGGGGDDDGDDGAGGESGRVSFADVYRTHMTAEGSKIDFTTFRQVAVQKRSTLRAAGGGRASALAPPPDADEDGADALTTQQILDRISSTSRDEVELVEAPRRASSAPPAAVVDALNADDDDDDDEQRDEHKQPPDGEEAATVENPVRSG